ncbi:MAG: glycosyltransferase family 39 protein [Alphaproteobacteria bacterium]|nr:glycosyltransferase family 39 protein [Alphaproteobacteria bacterium]
MTAIALPTVAGNLWRAPGFHLLLSGYYLVHVLLRPWLTATAGSDDADQLLFSQMLAPGYDVAQQPLYTWLVWASVRLLGPGVAAAAFVKYTLLLLIHALTYGLAGRFVRDERARFLAGFSPLLIYPMAWRLHEADTHALLGTALVLALVWMALRTSARRRLADYATLGVVAGLALLTSLYLVFAVLALWIALLLDRRHAAAMADPRLAWTIGTALLLFLPHGYWLAGHAGDAKAVFDIELRQNLAAGYVWRVLQGLGALIAALLLVLFPLWLFVPLIFPATLGRLGPDADERLLLVYAAAAAALLLLFLFAFGIAEFSHFRLYPVFWPLSLFLFRRIDRAGVEPRRARFMAALAAAVFVMVVQLRVQQIYLGPAYCKTCRLQAPYPAAARAIARDGFSGRGTILADDEYLAGNMRVQFPEARVLAARYRLFRPTERPSAPGDGEARCLVAWEATWDGARPGRLDMMAREALGLELRGAGAPRAIEALVPYSGTALVRPRTLRLSYLLPDPGASRCR